MVFPVILLSNFDRTFFANIASFCHFLAFFLSSIAAAINYVVFFRTRDSLVPLVSNHAWITGHAPLFGAFFSSASSILSLLSWIFVRDQRVKHTRWKPTTIREGWLLYVMALIFTLASFALHGFYKLKFDKYASLGIFQGMLDVDKNLEMKIAIDEMQSDFACCGVNGYTDWLDLEAIDLHGGRHDAIAANATWAHCRQFYEASDAERALANSSCYVPPSCCRPDQFFCTPWAFTLRDEYGIVDNSTIRDYFHSVGCTSRLHRLMPIGWHMIGLLAVLFFQAAGALISQLFSTSVLVIEALNLPDTDDAPGWIFPIGNLSFVNVVKMTRKKETGQFRRIKLTP